MPKVALTDSLIQGFEVPAGEDKIELCCNVVTGFLLERRATSPQRGTFWFRRYRREGNKYVKIGVWPEMSLTEARARAIQIKAEIAKGNDFSAEAQQQKAVPTFADFAEKQYLPYAKARKRSHHGDALRLKQRLLPRFGDRVMDTITKKELVEFHLELKALGLAAATCDHFLKLVRHMYNLAIEWEVVKTNPAAGAKLFNLPNFRDDSLNEQELQRLLQVLQTHRLRSVCNVALLLLATGTRVSEALKADWCDVDLDRGVWLIPADTNKSKRVKTIPLNETAVAVLEGLPTATARSGPLFLNRRTGKRMAWPQKGWFEVRKAAGLPSLRLHGLRHAFASLLARKGVSIQAISKLLGHSNIQITAARYAHLDMRSLQDAAAVANDDLQKAMPKLLPVLPPVVQVEVTD